MYAIIKTGGKQYRVA
ncbi:MAG: bL21 family ribosomal protein, partial [Veillonella sp.]|nr:50S ribosomal protein L21 [Veillonella atypica]MBD9034762.1 50S ribosomal protein L21 [Veillonella atypica]MBS6382881.1 bL21 family ribosomal protein [Veillonella dispar]MBS6892974.1 bL21 family ribosomal protein [Veillonella sp.]